MAAEAGFPRTRRYSRAAATPSAATSERPSQLARDPLGSFTFTLRHERCQSTKGPRTARPVMVRGVMAMNSVRIPLAQGTGPSFHNDANV